MSPGFKSRLLASQSDERLVLLVRAGSEPAFEALVHRYRRPLLRYCRRLCLSDARAEEALQQALMNAWVALRRDVEVGDLRAWLYRIAHNAAINAMRGERSLPSDELPGELIEGGAHGSAASPAGTPSIDDVLALRDALAQMAALPQMQREVIVRTAVGGHSHTEVASALGISAGAVRGLLYRARASLREGVTAITPMPLLAWIAGAGGAGSSSGERVAELAAGGTAGIAGIAAKGAVVAITASVAIGGAVIARDRGGDAADRRARAPHGEIASAGSTASSRGVIGRVAAAGGKPVGESHAGSDATARSLGRGIQGPGPTAVHPGAPQAVKSHRELSTRFHVAHRDSQAPIAESHRLRPLATEESRSSDESAHGTPLGSQPAASEQGGSSGQTPGGGEGGVREPESSGESEDGGTPQSSQSGDWHAGESHEVGGGEVDSKDSSSSLSAESQWPAAESAGKG